MASHSPTTKQPSINMSNSAIEPPVLSPEEREDIRYIIEKSQKGIARTMDLTDPREYRFYKKQLELGGLTPDRFPQTFKVVEDLAAGRGLLDEASLDINVGAPVNVISQIASTDGQNYTTSAMSSIPGGTTNTSIIIGLYDVNNNAIGPLGSGQQSGDGKGFSVGTTGNFGSPMPAGGRQLYSIASVQYTVSGNTTLKNVVTDTFNFPDEINNINPRDIRNDNKIVVCLTRSSPDCDYSNAFSGNVQIPIQGNIVYFGNIDVDGSNKPVNASNIIQIVRIDGGGNPLTPPAGFNFFNDPKTIASGKTLTWDLSWMSFGTPNFNSGDTVYYIFSVVVQVGGQDVTAFITNAPSSVVPGQTQMNTLKLSPMIVYYGCLAADAAITMEDGSTKLIADVKEGDRIISNSNGTILTVKDLTQGVEEEPMIRIVDADGHSLLLTEGHPVCTTGGVLLARQLEPGHELLTANGSSAITAVSKEDYGGIVHNLRVGIPDDGVELKVDNTSFIASGIVVGDAEMQQHYGAQAKKTVDEVLRRIPKEWHTDYLNSL